MYFNTRANQKIFDLKRKFNSDRMSKEITCEAEAGRVSEKGKEKGEGIDDFSRD